MRTKSCNTGNNALNWVFSNRSGRESMQEYPKGLNWGRYFFSWWSMICPRSCRCISMLMTPWSPKWWQRRKWINRQYNRKSTTSINGQLLIIWSWMSKRQRSSPCHFWRPSLRSNHWPSITDLSRWRILLSYWVFNYLQISNWIHISITCVPRQLSVYSPWECWNVMVSIHGISVQCIVTSSDLFWSMLVRYGTLPYRHSKVTKLNISNNVQLKLSALPCHTANV
jgi:hypothetical protein